MTFRESGALHLEVLTQVPARNVPMEIDIFDGSNPATLLETLEGATDISFEQILNEVGAGRFMVSVHDPKARPEVVDRENLAKVKLGGVHRFSFWMESRRIVTVGEGEEAEEKWEIGGREGTLAYLDRGIWYHQSYAGGESFIQDGKWRFSADQSGDLMVRALIEALARSPSPIEYLTYDFGSVADSQGSNWPLTTTIDVDFGTSLLDFLKHLAAMGELDFRGRHDLRLQAYVALGRHFDVESLPEGEAVVFRAGQNVRGTMSRTTSRPQVKTRMLVRGKGEQLFEVQRPDLEADALIRRREGYLSFGDSADPTTVQRAAEADMVGRLADQESIVVPVTHGDGPGEYEPFTSYQVGDWATLDEPGVFDLATHRIVAMAIKQREDTYDVDLTFNSVAYEALLRLARKTGATGGGGSGGTSAAVGSGSTGGGEDNRVAVESGDTSGMLYDKIEALGGTVKSIEGAAGSRKVGIRSAAAGVEGGFAPLSSGLLVPVGYLGSGAPDATKFLRGDGTWAVPAGGGGGGYDPTPGTGTYDATVILHPNLIGYWPLDEIAGVTYGDDKGAFPGTGTAGQVLPGVGVFDGRPCVLLNGDTNSRITMGTARTIPAQYTLEIWCKPAAMIDNCSLIGKWLTQGVMLFWSAQGVQVHQTAQGSARWRPGWAYWLNDFWHHIVGTYDGVTARLYVDGVLQASAAYAAHAPAGTANFEMGSYSNGASAEYSGYLAAGALYDAAIPLIDIEDHYERGTGLVL